MKKKQETDVVVSTHGMGSKMRIKLFDPKTNLMVSDRLVEQATEFLKGPTEMHKGPITIEANLFSQTQIDMLVEYLKKLKGDIPIVALGEKIKTKKDKTINTMLSDKEPLLDLVKTVKAKCKTQEQLINMLREYEFKFVTADIINDMRHYDEGVAKQIELRQKDVDNNFQYMVRLIKEAKEPMNDKYDFRLVFAVKFIGDRIPKVMVYLWGKWTEYLKLEWEKPKEINFKKVEKVYVFPEFMDIDERKKWRTENRKVQAAKLKGEAFEESKFYKKWTPYVKGF